jgi:hypothetical protein
MPDLDCRVAKLEAIINERATYQNDTNDVLFDKVNQLSNAINDLTLTIVKLDNKLTTQNKLQLRFVAGMVFAVSSLIPILWEGIKHFLLKITSGS